MKKILKLIALSAFLLFLAGGLVSCRDKEEKQDDCTPTELNWDDCTFIIDNFVSDSSANIIGKWKLERVQHHFGDCFDYSQCNVVFEFKTNGIVTVSGLSPTPEFRGFLPLETGNYLFSPANTRRGRGYQIHTNIIGNIAVVISIDRMLTAGIVTECNELEVDGPTFTFIRISPNNN